MKNCKSYMIIAHVMLSVSCLVYFACHFFDKFFDIDIIITMNRLKRRRPAKFVHAVEKRKPSSRLPAGNF